MRAMIASASDDRRSARHRHIDRSGSSPRARASVSPDRRRRREHPLSQHEAVVVLFHRDLRVHDHPALHEACRSARYVVPLFVLDDAILDGGHVGPNRVAFLLDALADLHASLAALGGRLVVAGGDVVTETMRHARLAGAQAIFTSADVSAHAQLREKRLERACAGANLAFRRFPGVTVVPPGMLRPADGDHFRVFTPYWQRWRQADLRAIAPMPRRVPVPRVIPSRVLPKLSQLVEGQPSPELAAGGEKVARARFAAWMRRGVKHYAAIHDDLAADATSRLSPHLHFGCLSPLELVVRAGQRPESEAFVRQICWRDFFAQVTAAFPRYSRDDYRPYGRSWVKDERGLRRWKNGRTGYPIVDAGMRQLLREGWMHNRARLVTASFLVKDLRIDWRLGAAHFLDLLVDGDVASNSGNWQWVAGTGNDPRPGRIFNPTRQAERFDPDGDYVRRWLPELASVTGARVHQPWRLAAALRRRLDYPAPIVDHAEAAAAYRAERHAAR